MIEILDSSAAIALFNDEEGADNVEEILNEVENDVFIHSINLCELYYDMIRRQDEKFADVIVERLFALKVVERNDFDRDFWQEVGKLKAKYRASLADLCGIVLTNRLGGTFVTADRHELEKLADDGVCSISFIR